MFLYKNFLLSANLPNNNRILGENVLKSKGMNFIFGQILHQTSTSIQKLFTIAKFPNNKKILWENVLFKSREMDLIFDQICNQTFLRIQYLGMKIYCYRQISQIIKEFNEKMVLLSHEGWICFRQVSQIITKFYEKKFLGAMYFIFGQICHQTFSRIQYFDEKNFCSRQISQIIIEFN